MRHIVIGILVLMFVVACADKKESKEPVSKADTSSGKSIAQANCAGCHGLDGRGANTDIPHLAAQAAEYLVASLNAYKEGKRTHAALKDMAAQLSEADITNVAEFYAGLPPVKTAGEAAGQVVLSPYDKGKAASAACASCHGENGNSSTAGVPNLAGQQPVYFISAVQNYLEGKRKMSTAEKEAMVNALNKVDIDSMALFYASQTATARQAPSEGDPVAGEPLSANCGGCHGAHGVSSDVKIPSLAAQDSQYLVHAVKSYQHKERQQEGMHKFLTNINDADIKNIAAYYAVQESKPAQAEPVSVQALVEQCDRCHSPGGETTSAVVFPKINGQNRGYLIKALTAYRDGTRESSTMHKMSLPYSDAIIDSLASVYSSRAAE